MPRLMKLGCKRSEFQLIERLRTMRPSGLSCVARVFLVLGGFIICVVSAVAEVPPAPPGYATEDEVKQAFVAGKLTPVNLHNGAYFGKFYAKMRQAADTK